MKKKVLSIVLAGAMFAAAAGCGSAEPANSSGSSKDSSSASSEDKDSKSTSAAGSSSSGATFTVGFDQGFPPMGFVGEDGEYTGFDLELAAEVAKRLDLEIKYQPIAWDSKDMELESGMIDCIWNGFTMNGREDSYAWSDAYMENDQVFVVKKDS